MAVSSPISYKMYKSLITVKAGNKAPRFFSILMAKNKLPRLTPEAGIWFGVNPHHMARH